MDKYDFRLPAEFDWWCKGVVIQREPGGDELFRCFRRALAASSFQDLLPPLRFTEGLFSSKQAFQLVSRARQFSSMSLGGTIAPMGWFSRIRGVRVGEASRTSSLRRTLARTGSHFLAEEAELSLQILHMFAFHPSVIAAHSGSFLLDGWSLQLPLTRSRPLLFRTRLEHKALMELCPSLVGVLRTSCPSAWSYRPSRLLATLGLALAGFGRLCLVVAS